MSANGFSSLPPWYRDLRGAWVSADTLSSVSAAEDVSPEDLSADGISADSFYSLPPSPVMVGSPKRPRSLSMRASRSSSASPATLASPVLFHVVPSGDGAEDRREKRSASHQKSNGLMTEVSASPFSKEAFLSIAASNSRLENSLAKLRQMQEMHTVTGLERTSFFRKTFPELIPEGESWRMLEAEICPKEDDLADEQRERIKQQVAQIAALEKKNARLLRCLQNMQQQSNERLERVDLQHKVEQDVMTFRHKKGLLVMERNYEAKLDDMERHFLEEMEEMERHFNGKIREMECSTAAADDTIDGMTDLIREIDVMIGSGIDTDNVKQDDVLQPDVEETDQKETEDDDTDDGGIEGDDVARAVPDAEQTEDEETDGEMEDGEMEDGEMEDGEMEDGEMEDDDMSECELIVEIRKLDEEDESESEVSDLELAEEGAAKMAAVADAVHHQDLYLAEDSLGSEHNPQNHFFDPTLPDLAYSPAAMDDNEIPVGSYGLTAKDHNEYLFGIYGRQRLLEIRSVADLKSYICFKQDKKLFKRQRLSDQPPHMAKRSLLRRLFKR